MNNKELINKIKDLSLTSSDREIARKINLSKDQVYRLRKKHKIQRHSNTEISKAITNKEYPPFKPIKKTLILTGWEIRVKPDEEFIKIINNIAKDQDAEKVCVPIWQEDLEFLPPIIKENFHVTLDNFEINSNLHFEYVPTHALVTVPSTQWKSFSHKSVIIPALLKDMQTLPSMRLPKLIATTGSIGRLDAFSTYYKFIDDESAKRFSKRWSNVSNRRGGNIFAAAKHFIEPSALIVDIYDDTYFHCRYITMKGKNVVYDLDKAYYADGRIEANTPKALILGDLHSYNKDEVEYKKSLEMIKYFQPDDVFIQDVFDGCSVNPHEISSTAKHLKFPDLDSEAEVTRKDIKEICEISKNVKYIQSNHDRFILDFLDKESNWQINKNYVTALELQLFRIKENKHPIIKLLDLDLFENLVFLPESKKHFVNNTLIRHGHETINGKRSSFYEQVKLYGSFIMGHAHGFRQWRDGLQVGKLIRSDIEYTEGSTGNWVAANGLLHKDDSKQGLFIIDGRWLKN